MAMYRPARDTVMFTGALGYIGQAVIPKLAAAFPEYQFVGVDPGWYVPPTLLQGLQEPHSEGREVPVSLPRLPYRTYLTPISDLLLSSTGEQLLDRAVAVFHLGGFSSDPIADAAPRLAWEANYRETQALARSVLTHQVPLMVYASSASVYDLRPFNLTPPTASAAAPSETWNRWELHGHLIELGMLPLGSYSRSKLAAEAAIWHAFSRRADYPTQVCILRQGTVYGLSPRQRLDLVTNRMVFDAVATRTITAMHTDKHALWRPVASLDFLTNVYYSLLHTVKHTQGSIRVQNAVEANVTLQTMAQNVQQAVHTALPHGTPPEITYTTPADHSRSYRTTASAWYPGGLTTPLATDPGCLNHSTLVAMAESFASRIAYDTLRPVTGMLAMATDNLTALRERGYIRD